ncbi:inositol monophosphatase family protein [Limosilactobacillus coleohominis 101-4-CHN]|uniref:Inositol monophosphatase family protein n=2 Tax=Limosilactobacillus coleohominis TaxID=181675 RepID=C7XTF7_9LACO|nr:inositol monophosphatase family protein [Limosilactobacillus coleohominis 101-4-CHN]
MMLSEIDQRVQNLMWDIQKRTLQRMKESYDVDLKTSYKDLVTTVDKENEQYLNQQLRKIDPSAQIISEEGYGDRVKSLNGHVFIVDPIDGTMNFVMQHRNFAIMVALYVDGKPTYGYIMDVMNGELYHGGNGTGVFVNDRQINAPANNNLHDSLMVVNAGLTIDGGHNVREVERQARGLRMYGSAGIEMIYVVTGRIGGYLSYLKPWDLAAGMVLAKELGLVVKGIDEQSVDVLSSNLVLVATKQVTDDVLELVN